MTEISTYFVRGEDGAEYGPVALPELREWVTENRVGLGTDVRPDSPDALWHPWQYYPELVALLAEVRVTGLPPGVPVLAPVSRRLIAGILDLVLCHILVMPLLFVSIFLLPVDLVARLFLQGVIPSPTPIILPFWFEVVADAIYFGGFLLYYAGYQAVHGRTPAKALLRLRVVDEEGGKPAPVRAFLRAFVLVISIFPLWSIPLFAIFFNPQRRGLHDLAAGTYVVEA